MYLAKFATWGGGRWEVGGGGEGAETTSTLKSLERYHNFLPPVSGALTLHTGGSQEEYLTMKKGVQRKYKGVKCLLGLS